MWILNICFFASASEIGAPDFIFHKTIFLGIQKNWKALQIFFVFFIKISCKSKEPNLSKQFPPLVQHHPF